VEGVRFATLYLPTDDVSFFILHIHFVVDVWILPDDFGDSSFEADLLIGVVNGLT
jgi:hypothetical protein